MNRVVTTILVVFCCAVFIACGGLNKQQRDAEARAREEAKLDDTAWLSSKESWHNEFTGLFSSDYTLKFYPDGTYTHDCGKKSDGSRRDVISGTWTLRDGNLVLTGDKTLNESQTKLVDAVVTYRIEWLDGRKRFKPHLVSTTVAGKVTKQYPANDLSMTRTYYFRQK